MLRSRFLALVGLPGPQKTPDPGLLYARANGERWLGLRDEVGKSVLGCPRFAGREAVDCVSPGLPIVLTRLQSPATFLATEVC
jgi:hypothetical protein